jgi:hypothetical protein
MFIETRMREFSTSPSDLLTRAEGELALADRAIRTKKPDLTERAFSPRAIAERRGKTVAATITVELNS